MSYYTIKDITSNLKRIAISVVDPETAWNNEATVSESKSQIIWGFLIPLMAICSTVSFLGVFLINQDMWFAIKHLISAFVNGLLGVVAISYITNELSTSFGGTKNMAKALKLVTFSASVFFLVASISRFMTTSKVFFLLLGFYSLYIFYKGLAPMLSIKPERKVGFGFIIFLLFAMVIFIIELLLGPLFSLTLA